MPDSTQHVSGISVLVNGAEMALELRDLLVEVRVRDTLALPDSATIRITDPKGERVDQLMDQFKIGTEVEIRASAAGSNTKTSIFKGDAVAFEPEFGKKGVEVVIRALDKGHKLQRVRKVRTFQQMSASDMVRKIAGENGLSADVTSTTVVHEFFQQSAETDWDLIARLARAHGYRFYVEDRKLCFKPAGAGAGAPIELTWQDSLMSFRPRVSGIQQVQTVNVRSWDPKSKKNVNGSSGSARTVSSPGVQRSKVSSDAGGGTTLIVDRPAANSGEANELAKSALASRAEAFAEAEGIAFGNPAVKAGCMVKITGVGQKLGGTYLVSSTTHTYRGATGYQTTFQIAGMSERGLLDLFHPPERHDWSRDLVVGVVTNNNDPEQTGRVRVKYPSLSDSEESAWARVASMSAGNGRGLMMLPQLDEEVIVGFEQGDTRRPIVLGSLFNGKDKPGADLLQNRDGSFALLSNEKAHIHTKKDLEIKSDQKMIVEVQQDQNFKVQGNMSHETTGNSKLKAQQYTVEAGTSLTVKGVSVTVEASASLTLKGATIDVQASGPLNLKGAIINIG
jgi:phage protein D/phage baseplate assembly protein gpV